jgi:hypothetical protein
MKTRFVVALAVVFSFVAATAEAAPGQKEVTVTVTEVVASPVADCAVRGVCTPVLRSVVAAPVSVVKGVACTVKRVASRARSRQQCRVASRRSSIAKWYRIRPCCN